MDKKEIKTRGWKIGKSLIIVGAAAMLTAGEKHLAGIKFGVYAPYVLGINSVLVAGVRQVLLLWKGSGGEGEATPEEPAQ